MIGKMIALGVGVATLPARLTWRSARAMTMTPAQFQRFSAELRQASDDVAREIQAIIAGVDTEMRHKAGHLSAQQKTQAATLALQAAEQHLSMAAVNMLRALWLSAHANSEAAAPEDGVIIDHDA